MRRGCNGGRGDGFPHGRKKDEAISTGVVGLSRNGSILFKNIQNLDRLEKRYIRSIEYDLKKSGELNEDENILGVFEKACFGDTMGDLQLLMDLDFKSEDRIVNVYSKEF